MNKYLRSTFPVAIIAVILLAGIVCRADSQKRMENRFLFVIDTSSSMKSRTNGIEAAISGLLKTDMHGEFREGDTLGIWTYDEKIHADFPMQVWSKGKKDVIISDVNRYLRHQRYENRSHLERVQGAIGKIMAQSDRLTVILIHDATESLHGTEFDGDINDLQKKYSRQFRSGHQPMVTVLSARLGQVFDYSINYPSSITIPHTALPLPPPPETNAPPLNAIAAVVPPTNAVPAEPAPPPRRIEIIMAGTNNLSRTTLQADSPANNPPPPQGNIVMKGSAQSQPQPQPQPQPETLPAPTPATPAPATVEPIANTPSLATSKPEPAAPETAAVVAQPEPAPVAPAVQPKTVPTPTPLPSEAATLPPASSSSSTPAIPQSPAPLPTVASAPAPSPLHVAAAVPAPSPAPVPLAVVSTAQQAALFVIAVSLLTIAVVLVVFLVRRSRGDSPPSLISQSIDRGR